MTTRIFLLLLLPLASLAQVDDIKKASRENSEKKSSGRSSDSGGSGGGGSSILVDLVFNGMIQWQRLTLASREENPNVVSLECWMHGAVQPSNYYVMNPRFRGNWGVFSTDFRINYLLEEGIDGLKDLRTNDWQIIQFNFVTTRQLNVRAGMGFMKEMFGDHNGFPEGTLGGWWRNGRGTFGIQAEVRWARDWDTGAAPRREWSAGVNRKLFDVGILHGIGNLGVQFQRYYSSINVWGVQAGLILALHR